MNQSLNEFIASASGMGEHESAGVFTLDVLQAGDKLKNFQLVDPYLYSAHLVSAACLSGASFVHLSKSHNTVRLWFDGRPFSAEELESLPAHLVIGGRSDRRLQELAIALSGAEKTGVDKICLETPGASLEIANEARTLVRSSGAKDVTTLTLTYPLSFTRLASAFEKKSPEKDVLKKFCRRAPITIQTDLEHLTDTNFHPQDFLAWKLWQGQGRLVSMSTPMSFQGMVSESTWSGPYSYALCLTNPVYAEVQGLRIVLNGVEFHRKSKVLGCKFACGVVYIEDLNKNVSHTDIAEDESYRQMLEHLGQRIDELWQEFASSSALVSSGLEGRIVPYLERKYKDRTMPDAIRSYLVKTELENELVGLERSLEYLNQAANLGAAGKTEEARVLCKRLAAALGRAISKHYAGDHLKDVVALAQLRKDALVPLGGDISQASDVLVCLAALTGAEIEKPELSGGYAQLRWLLYLILTEQLETAQHALEHFYDLPGWETYLKAELSGEASQYVRAAKTVGNSAFLWNEAAAALRTEGAFVEGFRCRTKAFSMGTGCDENYVRLLTREASGKVGFPSYVSWMVRSQFYTKPSERFVELEEAFRDGRILAKFALQRLEQYKEGDPDRDYLIHVLIWAWRGTGDPVLKKQALKLRMEWLIRRMLIANKAGLEVRDHLPAE